VAVDAIGARMAVDPRQAEHFEVWSRKPALRILYADYHRRLAEACPQGPILEVGGGTGHFKGYRKDAVSIDILPFPGIDVAADAHRLPFRSGHFAGVVMLDVLHHLERPVEFLREAARVLRPGGVIAMIEPGMSRLAHPIYRRFHQELADMSANPFEPATGAGPRDPFDSNQAIPTLLFEHADNRARLASLAPELAVKRVEWLSLIAFPLSGGFKRWGLVPASLVEALIRFEDLIPGPVRSLCGFRLFVALQRT
jgi:SAM-dependent methyltransferase